MLSDDLECIQIVAKCQGATELRRTKDSHIKARIGQYGNRKDTRVDFTQCPEVKEYLESGRAEVADQTTEGGCNAAEVIRDWLRDPPPLALDTCIEMSTNREVFSKGRKSNQPL